LHRIPIREKFLAVNIFFSLCVVTVGLVSLWAVLGEAQPSRRGSFVFILSPILGILFAIAASANYGAGALIILAMILYSATMVASLLIVRFCGYRLVRGDSLLLEQQSGEGNVDRSLPV
jgi:hypothetical protein